MRSQPPKDEASESLVRPGCPLGRLKMVSGSSWWWGLHPGFWGQKRNCKLYLWWSAIILSFEWARPSACGGGSKGLSKRSGRTSVSFGALKGDKMKEMDGWLSNGCWLARFFHFQKGQRHKLFVMNNQVLNEMTPQACIIGQTDM